MVWGNPPASPPPPRYAKVCGVPLRVHPSGFIIAGLLTWTLGTGYFPAFYPQLADAWHWGLGLASAILLFACVFLHELGHAVVARHHGMPVLGMTLFIFGGIARIGREPSRPVEELRIALAGPAVSGVLALACWLAARSPLAAAAPAEALMRFLGIVNVAIIIFNVLPSFPLDGGRVLRALLWARMGDLDNATRLAGVIGLGLAIIFIGLGVVSLMLRGLHVAGVWYLLIGWYLRSAARATLSRQHPDAV